MKTDLNNILHFVEKRPGMYLSQKSVYELSTFISGYDGALKSNFEFVEQQSFMNWVENKYCISNGAWHWSRILHHIAGTEREAFNLFFQIWPEYWKQRNKKHIRTCESYEPPKESVTNNHWLTILNEDWKT